MSLRIGAVSYLNTKPLIYGLKERLPDAHLLLDLPSRLADRLRSGDLDVALIPSVEFLRSREMSIVSDACIACHGPVRSVRLLFRTRPDEVVTLALDEGSRTSAVLAQVLLFQRFGIRPLLVPLPIETDLDVVKADGLVVIGDRAMHIDTDGYEQDWDLGEEWTQDTGLPFVFAMWVSAGSEARTEVQSELSQTLQDCRDQGLACLPAIVAAEADRNGLTVADCTKYFMEQLYFHLGPRELRGLELFRTQAAKLGLIPLESKQLSLQPL